MAIVTISRELAALGDETAQELAKLLDYRLMDKKTLEERIMSYGVSKNELRKYDEKKPSLFASLSRGRDDYLHFLKTAVIAEAGQPDVIFVGRGASAILKDVPGMFSVFLAAPPGIRLERVKGYFSCDERRAQAIIEKSDRDREAFHRLFFDVKWKDAGNYHLVLNTGHLGPGLCAQMIKHMLDKSLTAGVEAQIASRIGELGLSQKIKHGILYGQSLQVSFLEVFVSEKEIILCGVVNAQSIAERALSCARELAPGFTVRSEIQLVQEFAIMP